MSISISGIGIVQKKSALFTGIQLVVGGFVAGLIVFLLLLPHSSTTASTGIVAPLVPLILPKRRKKNIASERR
jgi:UPF0716 family protein affecting phage T7 exclusion